MAADITQEADVAKIAAAANASGLPLRFLGLIVGLIFLVIIGGITTLMNSSNGMYAKIKTFVGGALN